MQFGLGRWQEKSAVYRDYKHGGSVITEKLYTDVKHDEMKKKKKKRELIWHSLT